MRAGRLDNVIEVQSISYDGDDGLGNPTPVFTRLAILRAQLVQASTEEFIRSYGITSEALVVFRTRYLEGVGTAGRIIYSGSIYDIKEIKEIGRRKGLEIRAVSRGEKM